MPEGASTVTQAEAVAPVQPVASEGSESSNTDARPTSQQPEVISEEVQPAIEPTTTSVPVSEDDVDSPVAEPAGEDEPILDIPTETISEPEFPKEDIQRHELETVSHVIIANEAKKIRAKENPTDAEKQVLTLDNITKIKSGNHKTTNEAEGIDFSDGNPILVSISGEQKKVLFIESADDENFICKIDGIADSQKISRSAFFDAQLVSEQVAILSLFPDGPEKKALELHIRSIKPPEETDTPLPPSDIVNKIIKEAAETTGIMTTAKVKELVNWRRDAIKDNHDIETQTQLDWLKGIEVAMEGKIILDQKAMKAILLSPDLEKEIGDVSRSIQNLEKYLEKYPEIPKDGPDRKELQELTDIRDALIKSKEKLHTDDPSTLQGSEIEKVLSGSADSETMVKFERNLKEAITKAEPTALLEQLCPKDKTWEEVLQGIKDEKRRKNLMLLLMVFGTFLFDGGKNLMPSLDGDQR